MTKPEDIPQDVWNQAKRLVFDFPRPSVIESIARAIMAAKAEEREACAGVVKRFEELCEDSVIGARTVKQEKQALLRDLVEAIRNRDTV